LGKREQYAEETRQTIISAARQAFAEKGYAKTRVEDIARLAGVATITVYSSVGGKSGLARLLIDIWTSAPTRTLARERILKCEDPTEILRIVATMSRQMREQYADIIYTLHDAAPYDEVLARSLDEAALRYRDSCRLIVERLAKTKGLKANVTRQKATDILWFYFGFWSWYTLHDENGWGYERSEKWLLSAARSALLKPDLIQD
jgi:AcrR family transcriptional regulator